MLRPRMLVAIVVAGAGLATAVWLPTRNDTAAASDRARGNHQSRDHDRRWYDRDRGHNRSNGRDDNNDNGRDRAEPTPSAEDPTAPPEETVVPTAPPEETEPPGTATTEPPATEPPATEPPATEPTVAPTTEPTVAPTTEAPVPTPPATDPVARVEPWKPFVNYVEGDLVTYDDVEYRVLQSHTSLPGWEPPAVLVIFKPLV